MAHVDSDLLFVQFRQALVDCGQLYVSAGRLCADHHPELISRSPDEFVQLMTDLQKGLVVKVYITIVEADRRWSPAEQRLAEELFHHVWNKRLSGDSLRDAVKQVSRKSRELRWYSLIRPFAQLAPLRPRIADLETVVMRLANLIARAEGPPGPGETAFLRSLQEELDRHLRPLPLDGAGHTEEARAVGTKAVKTMRTEANQLRKHCQIQRDSDAGSSTAKTEPSREERLANALAQLDDLVGMESIKHEVRTLTSFLKVQQHRAGMDLPQTDISLHMVFTGNPGTGKTTVARIVAQIFGAMGILDKGHLVETDRSGLVAQYAGQTGPKSNKKVDEALDGVLFIDEAYSLIAEEASDPYGHEAVQAVLKRMEDDRSRLVVVLAGYPEPIDRLLRSNPGLASRFQRHLTFEDYRATELCRIFEFMCTTNHYVLPAETRAKLLWGFQWVYEAHDEYFGNARLVRNTFEDAIRRLANRVAGVTALTKELLTVLEPTDIQINAPAEMWERLNSANKRVRVHCEGCTSESVIPTEYLGRRVKCKKCEHRFIAAWGEPCDVLD